MIIKFDKELTKQEIYANGVELAQIMGKDTNENGERVYSWPDEQKQLVISFNDPVLMTDDFRISQLEAKKRYTLFALLRTNSWTTEYDGTSLVFDQKKYAKLWGPNIDTLFFCRALNKTNLSAVKKALEIGAGSGFISKYVSKLTQNLDSLTMIDLNKSAWDCWNENIYDKRIKGYIGDALEFAQGRSYDLILCNPPYIPRKKSIGDNAYEGLDLIAHLLINGKDLLNKNGKMILNFSSLCEDFTKKLIDKSSLEFRKIDEMEVPLKINNVLNNETWLNYLIEEKGLREQLKNGHPYWHKLNAYEFRK